MKNIIPVLIVLITMVSCQQTSTKWSSMKVIQGIPQLSVVNLRDTAIDQGDGMAFEAGLRDTSGANVGELHGWLITVDLSDADNTGPYSNMVDKIGTMVFNINGDDIIAFGETSYGKGKQEMNDGKPQRRAIMGGTGKYRGITGEVLTTRNTDSTYTHELVYKIIE